MRRPRSAVAASGALTHAYRFSITMIKITVLYGHPDDPAAFERHFHDVHIPLVNAMPHVRRVEKALVVATSDGSAPPYYRVVELYFDSEEELQASRATPEGRAPGEDVPNSAGIGSSSGPVRYAKASESSSGALSMTSRKRRMSSRPRSAGGARGRRGPP